MTQPEYRENAEHRETGKRLRAVGAPPPPSDLANSIKAEIPNRPVVVPIGAGPAGTGEGARRRWLVAATIAVAVVGASLTYRLSDQARSPKEFVAEAVAIEGRPAPSGEASGTGARHGMEGVNRVQPESESPLSASRTGEESSLAAPEFEAAAEEQAALPKQLRNLGYLDSRSAVPEARVEESFEVRQSGEARELLEEKRLDSVPPKLREIRRRPTPPVADEDVLTVTSEAPLLDVRARHERSRPVPAPAPVPAAEPPLAVPPSSVPPSTGGTTEPNDQPFGDTFFKSYGVNPFIDTEDDNLSTFAMDVDTGSYTVARGYLARGHLPPSEAIRVEEMVNFFDYGDAPPTGEAPGGSDFAIQAEGAPTPFGEGPAYRLVRFNVRGRVVDAADRKPATLVFVVDVSGSMAREDRLGLVKQSLGLLLDQLRPDDRVGLVVYGSVGRVLLEPTGDRERIRSAIGQLGSGGSTNAEEGLVLAYDLAERHLRPGAINRIVLCSDGVANVGRTGPDSILARIGASAERGIELTTVGFGMGNYNDILMEQLADRGDGNYAYVDSLDEARRVFVENLTGTLQTIARDAKIQVEFNPEAVSRYRLLGYENRDVADELFRDDSVDAGEIGAGHSVTALYEIKLRDGARRRANLATLRLRYQPAEGGEVVETSRTLTRRDLAPSWEKASAGLQLASVVAEYAEILRHSYWAREGDLAEVLARAQSASAGFLGDVDVAEFVGLVGKAARLVEK